MKKLMVVMVLVLAVKSGLEAQTGKPATKPAAIKPALAVLKNINDSASYAVGVSVANFYKQQGITKLNTTLVSKGITDVFGSKKTLLDDATCNSVMNTYMNRIQQQKSKGAIDSGEAFLKKNKLKPGIKTTASGLQYEVIAEGSGPKPTATDSVTCHYKGTLLNGFPFDDSYSRGQPITFALRGVIPGWTEGLQLMNTGSKYRFFIPYTLGYGAFDYGPIPGGSMLIFEVELLEVRKAQEAKPQ
ncbi:MAG TPA: FKBP-type peptidyl-prolyl cis-trans isomerase [Chitinophagaceae bacterium]|nr:FKBP-type peptidyl-prolyl cis-trans isomerase [Chitinophagaceae bacterium]